MMLDYEKGSIIRIKDYVFEDGTKKDKYLIVLDKDNQNKVIIHSLTTSKLKFMPTKLSFGCNIYQKNEHFSIPYFYFPKEHILDSESGFFFDIDTYVFFQNNTTKVDISLIEQYNSQPFGLICLGKLNDYNIKRLIKCIMKSSLVPNDIKAILKDKG